MESNFMPKIRTCSSAKKRFKITGSGKLRRHRATMTHGMGKKTRKLVRHNRKETSVDSTNEKQILRLLGK
jgi:large subunit ribosomal protein L35